MEAVRVLIVCTFPWLVAWYVTEKAWEHRRHWFKDPGGIRLPKIEVACLGSVLASLGFLALVLG